MANTLNLIKDTKATTTSTTTSSILGETTKDKPSLFDSLLANNTSGNKEIVDSALKIVQTPEIKSEENIEKELKTTTSLLDRMILEAKKDIKTTSKEEVTNLTQEVNKEILINPETIENTEEVKDLTKNVLENNKNHEVKSLEVEKVLNTIPTI